MRPIVATLSKISTFWTDRQDTHLYSKAKRKRQREFESKGTKQSEPKQIGTVRDSGAF